MRAMKWSELLDKMFPEGTDSVTKGDIEKATKGMKFVDIEDGEYVGKDKFEAEAKKAREAKTAAEKAAADLAELKKAEDADDSPSKQLEALNKRLDEESKARQDAEARAVRKEREAAVADKVASPKLRRTLLQDAEALMADDDTLDFEAAVAKAIEADADYAPKTDDDGNAIVTVGTGPAALNGATSHSTELQKSVQAAADAAGVKLDE